MLWFYSGHYYKSLYVVKKKSENDRPIATAKLLGVQITISLIAVSECDEKKAHCEISKNILPPNPKQS